MHIFKREMRAGRKAFVFWMIGIFVFSFIGIVKFQSYSASGSMTELLNAFPRVVLAVMGVVGVDMSTLTGYTALLFYYVMLCAVLYAVHLGAGAVSRESVDQTHEFLFTKPVSRARILGIKFFSAYLYMALFCACNAGISVLAVATLQTQESVTSLILLYTVALFLVGALFIAVSAFLAAAAKKPEKGALYGNLAFLYAFLLGIICNMLERPGLLRLFTPFQYFPPADMLSGRLAPGYALLALALGAAFLYGAFVKFQRKDLL